MKDRRLPTEPLAFTMSWPAPSRIFFADTRRCRDFRLTGREGGIPTGLPVELQVEKQLGITKDDIGKKISIEAYNQKCRETVMMYRDQWNDLTEKMGYWVDLEHPYITYEKEYIESLWWILRQL